MFIRDNQGKFPLVVVVFDSSTHEELNIFDRGYSHRGIVVIDEDCPVIEQRNRYVAKSAPIKGDNHPVMGVEGFVFFSSLDSSNRGGCFILHSLLVD